MATLDLIPAVRNVLLANAALLARLPGSTNGIIVAGNLALGRVPDNVGLPLIALKDSGTMGSASGLPFEQNIFHVRVYDNAVAANNLSYVQINPILEEVIHTLHRVSYITHMSYESMFEILFDNYKSPELFDEYLKLPYRFARFRAFLVRHEYDPR